MPRWLLPEGICDILPNEARRIEELRRRLLDLYRSYGYELVMPPLIEYLDSLLTGSGHDLDLSTFKLIDQLSGKTMGVRADITPQVARIDAHLLGRAGVVRLSYSGSVLHTRPAMPLSTREPLQVGAELYGHAGLEADFEIIDLLMQSLRVVGVGRARLDLGHVGIVQHLLAKVGAALPALDPDELLPLIQSKDVPGLRRLLQPLSDLALSQAVIALPGLFGEAGAVLSRARAVLPDDPVIRQALSQLEQLALARDAQAGRGIEVELTLDLGDARGYRYHSGVIFAAYVDGCAAALGRGGRYDNVGAAFGRSRAATGFSLELRDLAALLPEPEPVVAIRAPWSLDAALQTEIARLRACGEIVVQALPGHEDEHQEFECDRELVLSPSGWVAQSTRRS
jgi:ATP phosphoribosyltransferase regulatory subunit